MDARDYRVRITGWLGQLAETTAATQQEAYDKAMDKVKESKAERVILQRNGVRGVGRFWEGSNSNGTTRRIEIVEV